MTDVTTTAPLDEVRGLADERARYEGWLAALEARRAATPAHVLERVRTDYEGRLRRVLGALDGHMGALRADEAALAGHHDERLQALGERRDALAEVELRTLVGEFPPEEGERQRQEVEGEITAIEEAVSGAATRLADLRGLLARVAPPVAAVEPTAPEAAPAAASAPDAGWANTPAAGAGAVPPGAVPPGAVPSGAAAGGDRLGLDAARAALGDPDVHGYTPTNHFAPSIRAADGRSTPPFAGQNFADAALGAGGGAVGGVAQEKTLRCPDCGAMNYPTEWYCEKCGGELAAL